MNKNLLILFFANFIFLNPINSNMLSGYLLSSNNDPVPLKQVEKENYIKEQKILEEKRKQAEERKIKEINSIIKGKWEGRIQKWDIESSFIFTIREDRVYLQKFGKTDDWIKFFGPEIVSFKWYKDEGQLVYKGYEARGKLSTCKINFNFEYTMIASRKVWLMTINCGKKNYYLFKKA